MSILENHDKIREIANDIKVAPPEMAWNKINDKLNNSKKIAKRKKSNRIKFWLSIAASLMVIFTCISVIYFESQKPPIYDKGKVASWEELTVDESFIYSVEQARDLNKHYNP